MKGTLKTTETYHFF